MTDKSPAKPLPQLQCDDCKKPMRVQTFAAGSNGLWDLTYKCDQCGRVTGVVHKPEEK